MDDWEITQAGDYPGQDIMDGDLFPEEEDRTELIEPALDVIRTGMYSDIGRRENQQDSAKVSESYMYIEKRCIIAVVCDGMGGLADGARASGLCVEKMYGIFNQTDAVKDVPLFYKLMLEKLDEQVYQLEDENGKRLGAGTTLVSTVIHDGKLFWASVGDSRIYLINDANILCITEDQNYKKILNERVKRGEISAAVAARHPKREALISYLGMGGLRCMDISGKPFELQHGDRILLCSDGLYRTLSENEMAAIVREAEDDMMGAARTLVQAAVDKGNVKQDNTTAVVIKYLGT